MLPPMSSLSSDNVRIERAHSPSSFPVLQRSREGRRNSTGNAPPMDAVQDDCDMESVKWVPTASELGSRLDGVLSPRLSRLAKQSYAKIAASQRPVKDSSALYRAEQMHQTGSEGSTASVNYAKDVDRHKAVITSVEGVGMVGVQNMKPVDVVGCSMATALSQSTSEQLVVSSAASSVDSLHSCPLTDARHQGRR